LGSRIQECWFGPGLIAPAFTALERAYGYRLYEVAGAGLWLLDLGIAEPKPGDRAVTALLGRWRPATSMRSVSSTPTRATSSSWPGSRLQPWLPGSFASLRSGSCRTTTSSIS